MRVENLWILPYFRLESFLHSRTDARSGRKNMVLEKVDELQAIIEVFAEKRVTALHEGAVWVIVWHDSDGI